MAKGGAGASNDLDRYEACIAECVQLDVLGLSESCAGCYGAAERCGLEGFCGDSCRVEPCSSPCVSCLRALGCLDELEACTGLPPSDCDR